MKTRFNTADVRAVIQEIQQKYLGLRVANCYDIDSKTYLIKLAKPDLKGMILLESGNRIHSTEFDWPKNQTPSGFAMKMRKHLKGRRLEKVEQLGVDRIVDLQFGSGEAAYHIILELYDRGNIVLTDHEYLILNILRPRTDGSEDVKFAVREIYPVGLAKKPEGPTTLERLTALLTSAKEGDNLKKVLIPNFAYGPGIIEHCLLDAGISGNSRIGVNFSVENDAGKLLEALHKADEIFTNIGTSVCKGFIIQKKEKKMSVQEGEDPELLTYNEFHPYLWKQLESQPFVELETFDKAVDEFFSKLESQKLDLKVLQQEKAAVKKLENVRKDHEKRLNDLQGLQEQDREKASLIELNLDLVDRAIKVIQSALANQIDWGEIESLVKEAQSSGDPVAAAIKGLKLQTNHITMLLNEPYAEFDSDEENNRPKPMKVDIDLGLTAYANARKYYDMKRTAASKEQKTIDASSKALKSAEKKTKETLKDFAVTASINKTRKAYWFEKFLWFISSENYLVIGGRDQQQNELIVKRYLKPGDAYVHADLHGASSVIIKNRQADLPIPPKTLTEAGTMAVCYSAAWDAKVVTSAWWVSHDQVSKTAPTGEYLTTGSFMIRGKKNYLPPCYLIYGFGFMFKLDEDSIERHQGERRVRTAEEDAISLADSRSTENEADEVVIEEEENEEDEGKEEEEKEEEEKDEGEMEENEDEEEGRNEETKSEEKEDSGSESEEDIMFPDTAIDLQHVKGDKYVPQRSISHVSQSSDGDSLHLGGDVDLAGNPDLKDGRAAGRLSAKQRRELKKAKKGKGNASQEENPSQNEAEGEIKIEEKPQAGNPQGGNPQGGNPQGGNPQGGNPLEGNPKTGKPPCPEQQKSQEPPKRGQKGKLKKIKEKYKDQDEEERELKMEILASAGSVKEKKKGKNKQQQKKRPPQNLGQQNPGQQNPGQKGQGQQNPGQKGQGQGSRPKGPVTLNDITVKEEVREVIGDQLETEKVKKEEEGHDSDEEKQEEDESNKVSEDLAILDTVTGIPILEDTLMYTIPVCAPYSCMVNYKYKVKLTPGSTKRGKAAKISHGIFLHEKTMTPREKELLRVVKDSDLSRNIPGKVKVSAPNLMKVKGNKGKKK